MTLEGLILFLLIGLAAGWLASRITRGGSLGLVGDLVVGVIGAILGGWMFSALGVSLGGGILGALLTALAGAIVLLYLLRLIKRA